MNGNWLFKKYAPGDTYRNSTADAFFDSETVSDPGKALVREGIQNSLDAHKIYADKPAMVYISILNEDQAPGRASVDPFFADVWPHYRSDSSGLYPEEIPGPNDKCTALVFEDLDTTGLEGDPDEWRAPSSDQRNDFFNFFRAEALTHKTPGERGSRGVGKATFFQASRIKTIFGLTIRSNDQKPLLMGRSVLRSHRLDDSDYHGDGYFGVPFEDHPSFILPIDDTTIVEKFSSVFRLKRKNESGLSVIVVWPDPEIKEEAIIQAVCENYFYTILNDKLTVMIETPQKQVLLGKKDLLSEVTKHAELSNIAPMIGLAQWATSGNALEHMFTLNPHPRQGPYSWQKSAFPAEMLDTLRGKFQNRERVAIRVPLSVRKRNCPIEDSYFDVYVTFTDSDEPIDPAFIREDILIGDVRPRTPRGGLLSMVVIDHEPLAAFLRLSENPSHTQWQTNRVKKDYVYAPGLIAFVTNSVRQIYSLAMSAEETEDKKILADLFPKPGIGGNGNGARRKQYVRITAADHGFSVGPGRQRLEIDDQVKIQVAYADNSRTRSALGRYTRDDFQFGQKPIQHRLEGAEVVELAENQMVIRILNPTFNVTVTGFDYNRDIIVDADRKG